MKILFAGGGTIGPVSPLLALAEEIKRRQPRAEFLWLATRNGPENKLIGDYGIPVKEIFSGKLRRYFSLSNIFDPLLVLLGFFQSLALIMKFRPQVVVSAGGFVAIPVTIAAWLLGIPRLIHQQDVEPSLTNKILAPLASAITTTFATSAAYFPTAKTTVTGNPVRLDLSGISRDAAVNFFKFDGSKPVVLIMGGGTGAEKINELAVAASQELMGFCQVIHLTGGKISTTVKSQNYRQFDFLTHEMTQAYAAADLVVSRGGMATLTELAALKKPAIIIPMPNSHQEANAAEFLKQQAVVALDQNQLTPQQFVVSIKNLVSDSMALQNLADNMGKVLPSGAAEKMLVQLNKIIKH